MKIFAVLDKRTGHYKNPMFFQHVVDCTRVMESIVNNPESDLYKWPLDYQLDQLGEFTTNAGTFKHDKKEVCQIMDLQTKKDRVTVDPVEEIRKIGG